MTAGTAATQITHLESVWVHCDEKMEGILEMEMEFVEDCELIDVQARRTGTKDEKENQE